MIIELNDIEFTYSNSSKKPVLQIPKWSVEKHEHTFILGPSGSGKSTLLNIIAGMIVSFEGQASVLNQPLKNLSNRQRDKFRSQHIGYVFQQFNLIPFLSAIENIQLANHFSNKDCNAINDASKLLASLNIDESNWRKPVSTLSIGQQQRVAIARALINKPELLIADEPTSALDEDNRDNFMNVLMELAELNQSTVIFVSHDKTLARHFKRQDLLADINKARIS